MFKISVVMPVYNVEKHLEKAVCSIMSQNAVTGGRCELEIILVDDCSPDNCGSICDRLADRYEYIHAFHHPVNKGLSESRNTGFTKVTGDYVLFMDSDDTVESDLFDSLLDSLEKNPADVVVFGLTEDYFDKTDSACESFKVSFGENLYLSSKEELRKRVIDLEKTTLYGYAWNKFYRTEYLRKIGVAFENITLIEDILFNIKVFDAISSLNILDITSYHYKKRMDESLTNKFVKNYYELHRERVSLIYSQYIRWGMLDSYVVNTLGYIYVRYIFSALQRNCDKRAEMGILKRIKFIKALYRDELFDKLIICGCEDKRFDVVGAMARLLKGKHTFLLLISGRFIYVIKQRLPMIFSRIKQHR